MIKLKREVALLQMQASIPKKIIISSLIMLVLAAAVIGFAIPNPNMILIVGLVLCSAMFGYVGGFTAAAIMLLYTLYFFSTGHTFVHFTPENLQKVAVSLIGIAADMTLVCGLKREEIRKFKNLSELRASVSALLDNMPALTFSKDAETGVYLACNQAFAEYAHKKTPEGVVGLTDAEIFDPVTAAHFVQDDRMALSMNEPYMFYEDVPDAAGNQRQFQTTKLKFIDGTGRLCTLGMCQDVTDFVRVQRENATTKEAYEKARSSGKIYSSIAQTLAKNYTDLFYVDLNTDEFIEYRTDMGQDTMIEKRRGWHFFDECRNEAELYVHPDDREMFLNSMDRRRLLEELDKHQLFKMTYRLLGETKSTYYSMNVTRQSSEENCIVVAVSDVDKQVRERKAAERMKEEHLAYSRINALTGDFIGVYVVDPESGNYREYSTTTRFKSLDIPKEGEDFFAIVREYALRLVYPEDLERFLALFTKESIVSAVEESGFFAITYRVLNNGKAMYARLKAVMVEEKQGMRLVVGVNDIDAQVRQEEEHQRKLAQAQNEANIDALTGVKNKHAYLKMEEQINRMIGLHHQSEFAIAILDVNNLKEVNDTDGHKAGDEYLRKASSIICQTFKHSPMYRVGGDEFAVLLQGKDYDCLEELVGKMKDHNVRARENGGIVIACGIGKFKNDASVAAVFERADESMYENKRALKAGEFR
ncbi:MAG: diguanylate cyclase [Clostridia bacterium]|nr:diguanylate cyclase [Clostridia bacterium]